MKAEQRFTEKSQSLVAGIELLRRDYLSNLNHFVVVDQDAVLVLDQGFGFLKPASSVPRFDFQEAAPMQAKRLNAMDVSCSSDGASYIVIVTG